MSKQIVFVLGLAAVGVAPALQAQSVNGVRVFSDFPHARFRVDGAIYTGSAAFFWPQGSKHFIEPIEPKDGAAEWGVIYEYEGWSNNLGDKATSTSNPPITADASLKWIRVDFKASYLLTVSASPVCAAGAPCPAPGRVETPCGVVVNDLIRCYTTGGRFAAYPGSGAIFVGWTTPKDLAPSLPSTYILNLPITEPTSITAQFMPATSATVGVTLQTNPPEFTVIADGARYTPPFTAEWGWNTVHTVSVDPVQRSRGVDYVFESWSDGGPMTHEVKVSSPSGPLDLVAHFVPAHTVMFQTSPANLRLKIDGQDWSNYSFGWLPGSIHTVSAPATQTDVQGRRYRFVSWSNGQPASFDYTAGPPAGDLRLIATYQLLGQATITSSPAGLAVDIDGASCATPCKVERDAGTSVTMSAPKSLGAGERSRLMFKGWLDGGSDKRVIELSADSRTYTASYATQNRVSVAAAPAEGASVILDPPSVDGFYDSTETVALTAKPFLGFRVRSWAGDINGTSTRVAVTADMPRSIVLLLDRVPAIAPLGVRNAASATALGPVVPGSLISIFGGSLAPALEVGPPNPLAQTLQGVTVRVGETFLPLIFVSPEQINAQLSATLTPGVHTLVVRVEGRPEVSVAIEVARNAPGLFNTQVDNLAAGAFVHANGQPVTREAPARTGEVISLFGTGLGPHLQTPPDGFSVEEAALYSLIDPVELLVGGERVGPAYAGRGNGVGIDVVRFTVPPISSGSRWLPVQVTVNSVASNVVFLPIDRAE